VRITYSNDLTTYAVTTAGKRGGGGERERKRERQREKVCERKRERKRESERERERERVRERAARWPSLPAKVNRKYCSFIPSF
jgi:hypothetical protein